MTTVFCAECDGRGRVVCSACRGDGLVRAILDVAGGTCLACKGSGWEACEACSGSGFHEEISFEEAAVPEAETNADSTARHSSGPPDVPHFTRQGVGLDTVLPPPSSPYDRGAPTTRRAAHTPGEASIYSTVPSAAERAARPVEIRATEATHGDPTEPMSAPAFEEALAKSDRRSPPSEEAVPKRREVRAQTEGGMWLVKAFEADGRDPSVVAGRLPSKDGTRKAQLKAELQAFDEALKIFFRLVTDGRDDLDADLATLCAKKALVHRDAGDIPGSISMFDRAIQVRERLIDKGKTELEDDLARACVNKAVVVRKQGDIDASTVLYDRAITIYQRLVEGGRTELQNDLATACMNKAVVAEQQKDLDEAGDLYDRAITIREKLIAGGQNDVEDDLARVYVNKANLLSKQGELDGAIKLYNRSIEIRERLVEQGRSELEDKLAASCVNKALVVRRQKDLKGAIALFNRAIKIYEKLIKGGRRELSSDRAQALAYRAKLTVKTRPDDARRDARLAISILETEVDKTHRADLRRLLDWAKKNLKKIL